MARRHYVDNAPATTITGTIDNAQTSFAVTSLVGFPTSTPWTGTLDLGNASAEQVLVTGVVGMTLTVTRNANAQGAFSHTVGASFNHTADAVDFDEANAHINATTNVHGITGTFVDTSSTQTLTNKTLSGGQLTPAAVAATPGVSISVDATTTIAWQTKNTGGSVVSKVDGLGNLTAVNITGAAATLASASLSGNASVGGTLGVTGASTLHAVTATDVNTGTLEASGASTLAAVSATTISSSAAATLASAAVTGNASVGGTLGVTGVSTLHATTTGALTSAAGTFSGVLTANNGLAVTGTATVSNGVTVAAGGANVTGGTSTDTLTVNGTQQGRGVIYYEQITAATSSSTSLSEQLWFTTGATVNCLAGMAYEVELMGGAASNTAQSYSVSVRKTNLAGTVLVSGVKFDLPHTAQGTQFIRKGVFLNSTGSTVNATLAATVTLTSATAVQFQGAAAPNAVYWKVTEIGPASAFTGQPTV